MLGFLFWVLRPHGWKIAWGTITLLGFSPIFLQFAASWWGDVPATFALNTPILIYFSFICLLTSGKKLSAKKWGIWCGIAFVAAFFTKETLALFIPLILLQHPWIQEKLSQWQHKIETLPLWDGKPYLKSFALSLYSLSQFNFFGKEYPSEKREFWKYMGLVSFFGIVWILPSRISTVANGPAQDVINYIFPTIQWGEIFKRITTEPFIFLVSEPAYGLLMLFAATRLFVTTQNPVEKFFRRYAFWVVLMWWWGTQGYPYNPLGLEYRLWLPLFLPIAVLAYFGIEQILTGNLIKNKKVITMSTVGFFVLASISLSIFNNRFIENNDPYSSNVDGKRSVYLVFSILVLLTTWIPILIPKFAKQIRIGFTGLVLFFLTSVFVIPAIGSVMATNEWQGKQYLEEKRFITLADSISNGKTPILADGGLVYSYKMYTNFKEVPLLQAYELVNIDTMQNDVLLLINKYRSSVMSSCTPMHKKIDNPYVPPSYVCNPPPGAELISKSENWKLYRIKKNTFHSTQLSKATIR
jgi:hypothetical protein